MGTAVGPGTSARAAAGSRMVSPRRRALDIRRLGLVLRAIRAHPPCPRMAASTGADCSSGGPSVWVRASSHQHALGRGRSVKLARCCGPTPVRQDSSFAPPILVCICWRAFAGRRYALCIVRPRPSAICPSGPTIVPLLAAVGNPAQDAFALSAYGTWPLQPYRCCTRVQVLADEPIWSAGGHQEGSHWSARVGRQGTVLALGQAPEGHQIGCLTSAPGLPYQRVLASLGTDQWQDRGGLTLPWVLLGAEEVDPLRSLLHRAARASKPPWRVQRMEGSANAARSGGVVVVWDQEAALRYLARCFLGVTNCPHGQAARQGPGCSTGMAGGASQATQGSTARAGHGWCVRRGWPVRVSGRETFSGCPSLRGLPSKPSLLAFCLSALAGWLAGWLAGCLRAPAAAARVPLWLPPSPMPPALPAAPWPGLASPVQRRPVVSAAGPSLPS
ncbi:uncharacterized protein PSFLO_04953 [Pseudozyma flocculosa]|uniref:Uncharacterized protein n=1 Tax=Pseudozyma flocculosa TaxID=84751 RepID=A0A5C3F536_9BASI|nr:uncharacterized protein PSFLO_04953 [Pseudozyma flocculosa]